MLCMEANDTQLAPTRSWRTHESGSGFLAHSVGNVPDAGMFGFQGSLSGKALRKQICLASCGENPLTIRWEMLSDFWTFLFSSHLSMDIFPPVVRYRTEYIFAAEGKGAAGQKRCPLTFQWTFFCPLSGITQNIFLLFCGSARLRHARFAWSCRAPQHMRTGFSPQ